MATKTWILYKTNDLSAAGWEDRKLMPSGGLTSLLWETIDYSGRLPTPGQRVRNYQQDESTGQITHGKEGDWVVTRVEHFSSFESSDRIIVCYCEHQPIDADWQPINRGMPVDQMLQSHQTA